MNQEPGLALENPCSPNSHHEAGDPRSRGSIFQNSPLPRVARDLDPMSGDFNALGVSGIWTGHPFAGHRTDRHTLGQTEGQFSRPKQPRERNDQDRGREQEGDGKGDQGTGPASFQESQPPSRSCLLHAKRMHAPGDSYTALPGLRCRGRDPSPPQPPRSDLV